MKKLVYFLAILAVMVLIAGCQPQQKVPEGSGTPIETTPSAGTQQPVQPQPQPSEPTIKISIISIPSTAQTGSSFNVGWKIESNEQKSITHTAVHYGTTSSPGALPKDIAPSNSGYPNIAGLVTSATIPFIFSTTINTPSQETIFYLRAHVVVDGKNYWSEEKAVNIVKGVQTRQFTIEADDAGIYPNMIEVNKGDNVMITFNVRSTNVYYGGLDIKSSQFETGTIMSGSSKTVTFTADQGFTFSSFWPATGVKKADAQVVVK